MSKKFGARVAVDGIDLMVSPGTCFGLLGPNGAGKTTTLRMIYGVTRAMVHHPMFGLDIEHSRAPVRAARRSCQQMC